jgi:hypothetical protein
MLYTSGLQAIWGSSSTDVFAVGSKGTILHYDGSSWNRMNSGTTYLLRGVWGSSPSDVFAVGHNWELEIILHYDGTSWSEMSRGTMMGLYSVWGSSPSDVFAVGEGVRHYDGNSWNDTILHYDGSIWSSMSSGTTDLLYDIWVSSHTDVFVVGDGGTILHYPAGARRAPTVTSISPEQAYQGGSFGITITGCNLSGATAVTFGSGITVNKFTVNNSTQITANITIDDMAATGTREISVTSPVGTVNLPDGFAVTGPAPTVTSIAPGEGNQGKTLDVEITGTNFAGATQVSFGPGITVNSYTVISPTQINANITIDADATLGAKDVSVTTLGGISALAGGFTLEQALPEPSSGWIWAVIFLGVILLGLGLYMLWRKRVAVHLTR